MQNLFIRHIEHIKDAAFDNKEVKQKRHVEMRELLVLGAVQSHSVI